MYITDQRPVYVNAQALAYSPREKEMDHARMSDPGAVILCKMNNGATVIVNGLMLRGHGNWYRLHGSRGLMENLRTHGEGNKLRIVHENWDRKKGDVGEKIYDPDFPVLADQARRTGHGGGDFFTTYHFADAIRTGQPPWLDVYRSLDMSLVAVQAWRSALDEGRPYVIPDFRQERVRKKYEHDHWSPFPEDADKAPNQPPPSIKGYRQVTAKQLAAARKVWKEMGYHGKDF
jgi:hypothetical protein